MAGGGLPGAAQTRSNCTRCTGCNATLASLPDRSEQTLHGICLMALR